MIIVVYNNKMSSVVEVGLTFRAENFGYYSTNQNCINGKIFYCNSYK